MDLSKYKHLFISETQENLETLGRLLVALEADPTQREHIDTVFRLFHSIKGMSGTMGYQPLFELSHQLEDLMDSVRKGQHALDPTTVDTLLGGVDRMTQWLSDVEADAPLQLDHTAERLSERIHQLLGRAPSGQPVPRPPSISARPPSLSHPPRSALSTAPAIAAPAIGPGDLQVVVGLVADTADPGLRGFLLVRKLEALGEVRWSNPPIDHLRAGTLAGPLTVLLRSPHPADKVEAFIRLMPDWDRVEVRAPTVQPEAADALQLVGDPDLLDALDDLDFDFESAFEPGESVELLIEDTLSTIPIPAARPERASLAPPPLASVGGPPSGPVPDRVTVPLEAPSETGAASAMVRARRAAARTIRVKTRWIDDLLDHVGDLLIVSQRLWALNRQAPQPAMSEGLGELSRLLDQLHTQALTARLTSFSVLTDRLPRVVRDLARQAGKRATLVIRGADEQVDRAIVEGLDAPITHLLRNAIEHGIEAPEVRSAANKPATGVLTLACVRVRDEIIIELGDDGQGVDRAAIVERVVSQRLMERAVAERAAARDLRLILCLPGFTTRLQAGAMAGRGVGMDVVHEQVTELGGTLEIHSEPAVGTLFRLRLPRSPGIGKLLLVEADGQTFGLPLARVVRTANFDPDSLITRPDGQMTVRYGHDDHRVVSLRSVLGWDAPLPDARFPAVILRMGRDEVVLAVDRVVGQQDAVVKPLGALLERIQGLHGVTLDPVGKPIFVVDISRLPQTTLGGPQTPAPTTDATHAGAQASDRPAPASPDPQ